MRLRRAPAHGHQAGRGHQRGADRRVPGHQAGGAGGRRPRPAVQRQRTLPGGQRGGREHRHLRPHPGEPQRLRAGQASRQHAAADQPRGDHQPRGLLPGAHGRLRGRLPRRGAAGDLPVAALHRGPGQLRGSGAVRRGPAARRHPPLPGRPVRPERGDRFPRVPMATGAPRVAHGRQPGPDRTRSSWRRRWTPPRPSCRRCRSTASSSAARRTTAAAGPCPCSTCRPRGRAAICARARATGARC